MLNELEAILNVARIASEKKSASLDRFVPGSFGCGDFRSELDAATDDTARFSGNGAYWRRQVLEVGSGVGLAGMCCEGASVLRLGIVRESVTEVVVKLWIGAADGIVFHWVYIDGCSCNIIVCVILV